MNHLTLAKIAEMTDEEVLKLSMPRPGHPEMRGFMFSLKQFESPEAMTECMAALIQRLNKINSQSKPHEQKPVSEESKEFKEKSERIDQALADNLNRNVLKDKESSKQNQ